MTEEWETADFAKILRKMRDRISIPKEPSNTAVISLDSLDKFLETYLSAIGRLRQCCEEYGIRRDLSDLGHNVVVFTNPPQGTFYCNVEYLGRTIEVAIYLRTLYLMGWTGANGKFDMKMENEERYMSPSATVLKFKKNYRFLAPISEGCGKVENVLIGLYAWQQAFEAMHKAVNESKSLRQAVATFAVHISEAARIQSVLKDICVISAEYTMETLDSRTNNSFWINNYGHYGKVELLRISTLCSGEVPEPIKDCHCHVHGDDARDLDIKISESEILNQIRIMPRDVGDGVFKCLDPAPSHPWETDKLIKSRKPEDKSTKGWKDPRKGRGGGGGDDGGSPGLYLLEDWGLLEEEKGQLQDEKEPLSMKSTENMSWVQDFLDVFHVQRIITSQRKEPTPPTPTPPPAITRIPCALKGVATPCLSTSAAKALAPGAISRTAAVKLLNPPAISKSKFPSVVKLASMTQKFLQRRLTKFLI